MKISNTMNKKLLAYHRELLGECETDAGEAPRGELYGLERTLEILGIEVYGMDIVNEFLKNEKGK